MCGIYGVVSDSTQIELSTLKLMSSAQIHRGPDNQDTYLDNDLNFAFGHNRLAIQDLSSAGNQPLKSKTGRYLIVFNGEIYNFQTIKNQLQKQGISFYSKSDTEVLLNSIEHWGLEKTLEDINGMFAFALLDRALKTLTLCRDRIGEKPLYYGWKNSRFYFSSELSSIEAVEKDITINKDGLALYLKYGYVPAPQSIYNGFYKLPPGSTLELDLSSPTTSQQHKTPVKYWQLNPLANQQAIYTPTSKDEYIKQLRNTLETVVSEVVISDAPLGCFLSGGIDSSLVTSMAQANSNNQLSSFTIGFNEPKYNEAGNAKQIAKHIGTAHNELYLSSDDYLDVAFQLPKLYDEPIANPSSIASILVSELARKHVTVSLSGDGGDELFCGYNRYSDAQKAWSHANKLPFFVRKILGSSMEKLSPNHLNYLVKILSQVIKADTSSQVSLSNKVNKLIGLCRSESAGEFYDFLISCWPQTEQLINGSVSPNLTRSVAPNFGQNFLKDAMFCDQLMYLPGDNLAKLDRASMSASLETRLPLLDRRVIDVAWSANEQIKTMENRPKWPLRKILEQYVPSDLTEKPKMGFSVPVSDWLRGPLKSWGEKLLISDAANEFELSYIQKIWDQHQLGINDSGYKLWSYLTLLDWLNHRNLRIL